MVFGSKDDPEMFWLTYVCYLKSLYQERKNDAGVLATENALNVDTAVLVYGDNQMPIATGFSGNIRNHQSDKPVLCRPPYPEGHLLPQNSIFDSACIRVMLAKSKHGFDEDNRQVRRFILYTTELPNIAIIGMAHLSRIDKIVYIEKEPGEALLPEAIDAYSAFVITPSAVTTFKKTLHQGTRRINETRFTFRLRGEDCTFRNESRYLQTIVSALYNKPEIKEIWTYGLQTEIRWGHSSNPGRKTLAPFDDPINPVFETRLYTTSFDEINLGFFRTTVLPTALQVNRRLQISTQIRHQDDIEYYLFNRLYMLTAFAATWMRERKVNHAIDKGQIVDKGLLGLNVAAVLVSQEGQILSIALNTNSVHPLLHAEVKCIFLPAYAVDSTNHKM